MRSLVLPPDVHFCVSNGCGVFLNSKSGRYIGTSAPDTKRLAALLLSAAPPERTDVALYKDLLQQKFLSDDPHLGRRYAPPRLEVATRSWFECSISPPSWRAKDATRLGSSFVRATVEHTFRSFYHSTTYLQGLSQKRAPNGFSEDDLLSRVARFHLWQPFFYSAQDKCLLDSLVLTHYLLNLGFVVQLVLGVIARPFQAHSWVQYKDIVLNDHPIKVNEFTPVAVIG